MLRIYVYFRKKEINKNMDDNISELYEKFLLIESHSTLFQLAINNIRIWQYIRYSFADKLLQEISGADYLRDNGGYLNRPEKQKGIQEFFRRQQFLLRRKDLLVINHPRRVKRGRYYECYVTETLLKNINNSYYVFESPYKGNHIGPAKTKNLKYRDITVLERVFDINKTINRSEISNATKYIIETFEKGFDIKLSNRFKSQISSMVSSTYHTVFYSIIYAKIILFLIRPKAILLTIYYDVMNQALIEVAKKKNIPVIELQHGRIGKAHIAYNYPENVQVETFPDYLFVYGEYEKSIPRYPIPKQNIYAVGYPDLEERAKYYKKKKKKNSKKIVTFMSSPIDGHIVADMAIKLHELNKDIIVVYKLHPSEYSCWKKNYPNLIKSGIKIVETNEHDIYYYLGHSDVVVGISSTTLYEALMFNTKIVVLKYQEYDICEPLYKNGCAALVSSVEEINDIIYVKENITNSKVANFYFEMDAISKMKKALNECKGKKKNDISNFTFFSKSTIKYR